MKFMPAEIWWRPSHFGQAPSLMPLDGPGPDAKAETLLLERTLHVSLEPGQGAITYQEMRYPSDTITSNSNRRVRVQSPGNIGPTSEPHAGRPPNPVFMNIKRPQSSSGDKWIQ
jgi:hypothetical protein